MYNDQEGRPLQDGDYIRDSAGDVWRIVMLSDKNLLARDIIGGKLMQWFRPEHIKTVLSQCERLPYDYAPPERAMTAGEAAVADGVLDYAYWLRFRNGRKVYVCAEWSESGHTVALIDDDERRRYVPPEQELVLVPIPRDNPGHWLWRPEIKS